MKTKAEILEELRKREIGEVKQDLKKLEDQPESKKKYTILKDGIEVGVSYAEWKEHIIDLARDFWNSPQGRETIKRYRNAKSQ